MHTFSAIPSQANALNLEAAPAVRAAIRRTSQRGADIERLHLEARALDPYEDMQEREEVAMLRQGTRFTGRAAEAMRYA